MLLLVHSHDSSDSSLVKVLHWGASKKPSIFPSPERLVELGAQQIVPSEGQCLVLTGQGTVVSLTSQGPGEFTETVNRIVKLIIVCIKFSQFLDVDQAGNFMM